MERKKAAFEEGKHLGLRQKGSIGLSGHTFVAQARLGVVALSVLPLHSHSGARIGRSN